MHARYARWLPVLVLAPILWGPAPEARAFVCGTSCGSACAGAESESERAACERQCEAAAQADCNEAVLENFALTVAAPEGFRPVDWDMKAKSICRKYCEGPGCGKKADEQTSTAAGPADKRNSAVGYRRTRARSGPAQSCIASCQTACLAQIKKP